MRVHNAVVPTQEQMEGFLTSETDSPIFMLNLLTFKEHAEYEDGRDTSLSGREAYGLYAVGVAKLLPKVGGSLEFGADVERLMLGDVEELWDQIAIAMYPSRAAMLEMIIASRRTAIETQSHTAFVNSARGCSLQLKSRPRRAW